MSENPYASSTVDPTPPSTGDLWRVEGKFLLVRDGAVLPPEIPLFGNGEKGLVQEVRVIREHTMWLRLFAMSIGVFPSTYAQSMSRMSNVWHAWLLLALAGVCYALHRSMAVSMRLTYVCDPRRLRQRLWAKVVLLVMVLMLGLCFLPPFTSEKIYLFLGTVIVGLVILALLYARNVPICQKQKDGWYYLNGMNAQALRLLDESQADAVILQTREGNRIEV